MHSSNQKCNLLQSVFGVFLHSCNTPQKVIQSLARMGLSISIDTIHKAVKSLSAEMYEPLHQIGKTLLVGYTYDNFGIDFKTHLPTVKQSSTTLTYMTSGTLIHLGHSVMVEHLRYSQELWEKLHLNPQANMCTLEPPRTYFDFLCIHPEVINSSSFT
jgi:hypothetical protein